MPKRLACGSRTSLARAFSVPSSAWRAAIAVTSSTPAGTPGSSPSATPKNLADMNRRGESQTIGEIVEARHGPAGKREGGGEGARRGRSEGAEESVRGRKSQ